MRYPIGVAKRPGSEVVGMGEPSWARCCTLKNSSMQALQETTHRHPALRRTGWRLTGVDHRPDYGRSVNVGLLLVGIVAGALIGFGVELQAGATRRRAESLSREGVRVAGTVTAVDPVGKYNSHRRIRVEVQGGTFLETVSFNEADELGATVGAPVVALVAPGDPTNGRIDRPVANSSSRHLGIWLGLFIAALGVIAAFIS